MREFKHPWGNNWHNTDEILEDLPELIWAAMCLFALSIIWFGYWWV